MTERKFLSLDPGKLTGVQLKDVITAIVAAVPDVEMDTDYSGLVFSHPDVVVPAEWIEPPVTP